jgi:hypothetical protein
MLVASGRAASAFLPGGDAEEAHGSPEESEVLHGNQQRHNSGIKTNHILGKLKMTNIIVANI